MILVYPFQEDVSANTLTSWNESQSLGVVKAKVSYACWRVGGGGYIFQVSLLTIGNREAPKVNLKGAFPPAFRLIVRVNRCCISIITSPTPNSTAEKIRKKKVRERTFRLSYSSPIIKVSA